MIREYRDRTYIRKDTLLKLYESGEMNQSRLLSSCGLNNTKHKGILDGIAKKGFLDVEYKRDKSKLILKYKISKKGIDILKEVFEPYEELFPREEGNVK